MRGKGLELFTPTERERITDRYKRGEASLRDEAIIATLVTKHYGDYPFVLIGDGDETRRGPWRFRVFRAEKGGPVEVGRGSVLPYELRMSGFEATGPGRRLSPAGAAARYRAAYSNIPLENMKDEELHPPGFEMASAIVGEALTAIGWTEEPDACVYYWLLPTDEKETLMYTVVYSFMYRDDGRFPAVWFGAGKIDLRTLKVEKIETM